MIFDCTPPPREEIEYTEENVRFMCRCIYLSEDGAETLYLKHPGFPSKDTIVKWCEEHPGFFERYMNARRMQALFATDNLFEIAARTNKENWYSSQALTREKHWAAKNLLNDIFNDEKKKETKDKETFEEWSRRLKEVEPISIEFEEIKNNDML